MTKEDFDTTFQHAMDLRQEDRYEEALIELKLLVGHEHTDSEKKALTGILAGTAFEAGRYEEAVEYGRVSVKLSPRSSLASMTLYHSLLEIGETEEARRELERPCVKGDVWRKRSN